MKCYNTLFTKEGLATNIPSYILIFITLLFIISGILFYKCGYFSLEECIKKIIDIKEKTLKKDNNNTDIKETININGNDRNDKIYKKIKGKNKKKGKNKIKIKNKIKNKKFLDNNNKNSFSKLELTLKNNTKLNNQEKNNNLLNNKKINKILNYNDYELNTFSYKDAKQYDKRNLLSFYLCLLKTKHILLFSFFPMKDYNSIIIKVDLFFLTFAIYYFINSLFFNKTTIHKIYEDAGIYDFIYLVPYILYSFIISHTLNTIIKYIFLSERNISQIKKVVSLEMLYTTMEKVKKRIVIKYITFFCSSISIVLFFWYYLSSFGAVYQNTQIYLIKNLLFSFGVEFIYPFIINLIPAFLRIISLKNSNRELLYKISKIIQII